TAETSGNKTPPATPIIAVPQKETRIAGLNSESEPGILNENGAIIQAIKPAATKTATSFPEYLKASTNATKVAIEASTPVVQTMKSLVRDL
ncbi:hypothetical protein WAJ70_20850, partial [Acinetobacter baumannii]